MVTGTLVILAPMLSVVILHQKYFSFVNHWILYHDETPEMAKLMLDD